MGMNDYHWMQQALKQAEKGQTRGEVPVGAVLVGSDGKLLAEGYNQVIAKQDPCAHAEIVAIRQAARIINNYRLTGTTLYVTLEPCPMCASALVHARIHRLVFGCRDFKTGAAGSVLNLTTGDPLNHRILVDEGILSQQCLKHLQDFFRERR
tara:strand:+ start:22 stop:477 length:456 start_codon:yes stop_codon:yes gene_type:complete